MDARAGTYAPPSKSEYDEFAEFLRYKNASKYTVLSLADDEASGEADRVEVGLRGGKTEFVIDTGSALNTISQYAYERLERATPLEPFTTQYFGYKSRLPIPFLGKFDADVSFRGTWTRATFVVVEGENLFSKRTCVELGVVSIAKPIAALSC